MKKFNNQIALITGGASGIGKIMGELLLQKGLQKLVIWDLNEELLNQTSQELIKKGFEVYPYLIDITNTYKVIEIAKRVKLEVGSVSLLINNAGIIVGKSFIKHSHNDIEKTIAVNTSAHLHITREFLPDMIDANFGHIVNIASAAGMVSNPNMSVYVASKWAILGWSDSLLLELYQKNLKVMVTSVTPFYIDTGMFKGVRSPFIPIISPMKAARRIINGIERNRRFVRMPRLVYALNFIKGVLPSSWFDKIVGQWLGVYHSMDNFEGRN